MLMPTHAAPAALCLSVSMLLSGAAPAQKPVEVGGDLESVLARYKVCFTRLPFLFHTEARQRLARTREAEALRILCQDYEKPASHALAPRPDRPTYLPAKRPMPSYVLYSRYTIASLLEQHFSQWVWEDQLAALRQKFTSPSDAWLWACTLGADSREEGIAKAVAVAREAKEIHLKAAAITGLARRGRAEVLDRGIL